MLDTGTDNERKYSIDITIRPIASFMDAVRKGEPWAIEVICLPTDFVLISTNDIPTDLKMINISSETCMWSDQKMKSSIRGGFSKKASWAEVRARKKLKDNEPDNAIKSLYHSLRILLFGIQIGTRGTIYNFNEGADYLAEMRLCLNQNSDQIDDAFLRTSYKKWAMTPKTEYGALSVATYYKMLLPM